MAYNIGSTVTDMWRVVKDATGNPANATTVTLELRKPDGTSEMLAVANPPVVTGTYGADYVPAVEGKFDWYLSSTNPTASESGSFVVRPKFPDYIISASDVREQLNMSSTTSDEELEAFIEATTAVIERHTCKTIVRRTVTERTTGCYSRELWLNHRPILSVTSIATTDGLTTWNVGASYVDIDPDLGRIRVLSGNYWSGNLVVTYVAGMTSIPPEYTMAARIIVQHLWQTQQQAGLGPSSGPTPFDDPDGGATTVGMGFAIPRRALELLGPPPPMVA